MKFCWKLSDVNLGPHNSFCQLKKKNKKLYKKKIMEYSRKRKKYVCRALKLNFWWTGGGDCDVKMTESSFWTALYKYWWWCSNGGFLVTLLQHRPSRKPFMWILLPLLCTLSPQRSGTAGGLQGEKYIKNTHPGMTLLVASLTGFSYAWGGAKDRQWRYKETNFRPWKICSD